MSGFEAEVGLGKERLASGPFVVRFDWIVSGGENHPPRSYLDCVSSESNALQAGLSTLHNATVGDVRVAAVWWRQVNPGESQAEGAQQWTRISLPGCG